MSHLVPHSPPSSSPAVRGGPVPTVYRADTPLSALDLSVGSPGRDECWKKLPPGVPTRLHERIGDRLEWFARESDEADRRPRAVVIGTDGLAFAEPRLRHVGGGQYRAVHVVEHIALDRAGLRFARVTHRPQPTRRPTRPTTSTAPASPRLVHLDEADRAILAGLPALAQDLLAQPFGRDEDFRRVEFSWESAGAGVRDPFVALLVSDRYATFALGRRVVPVGHDSTTAHWELGCYSAPVLPRPRG